MTVRLPLLGTVLLAGLCAAAQPVPPPDPADDPLPPGAKTRFGVTRPILRANPHVGLVPPKYTNFLAPTLETGVRRYDLGTGRPLAKVTAARELVGPGAVVVSADGKRAAVARTGTVAVVDADTGKRVLAVRPPAGVVLSGTPGVALSADGKVLAYGGRGAEGKGEVVVWDVDKDELLARVVADVDAPVHPTLSRDGKTLATHGPPAAPPRIRVPGPGDPPEPPPPPPAANADALRTAQVWEVATGKELFKARVTGMGGAVVAAAFAPDGKSVALSAGDGPVDVWDVPTGKRAQTLLGRKGQGVKVAFAPDGKTIASVAPDYRIERWAAADGKSLGVTEAPAGILIAPISGLEFADHERVVAWVTAAQFAVAWEAPNPRLLSPQMDHQAAILSVGFPDGNRDCWTSGVDGRVFRWGLADGELRETVTLRPARLPGQPPVRPTVYLAADAGRASGFRSPNEVYDTDTGENLFVVPPPSAPPAPVRTVVSPDGMKLITVCRAAADKRVGACTVWDLATKQRVVEVEFPCAPGGPPAAAMNHANTRLVVAATARTADGEDVFRVTAFDAKTGKVVGSADDPSASGAVFLAAGGEDSAVLLTSAGRLWAVDYVAGKVADIDRLPARGEGAAYVPVVFSPDGKRFATGVNGAELETYGVRVYDWETRKPTHAFVGHAGPVNALRFAPDGKAVASGAQDTSVLLWDLTKPPPEKKE